MLDLETVALRIALAIAFGAVVGIEREWRQKHAGLKTMTLVSVGAAGFALMSDTFGADNHNPAQIAAAVVGGIGFIGAGVIMHRGMTVQGVTTAATLWATASMGVAVGLGEINLAVVLATALLIVQVLFRQIESLMMRIARRDTAGRFELVIECDSETLQAVNTLWTTWAEKKELLTVRRSISRGPEHINVRAILRAPEPVDLSTLEEGLVALDGVRRVDVRHLAVEDGD